MKTCHNCKTEKPLSEFNKNKAKKDGLSATCRECMKTFRKKHYDGNSSKVYKEVRARRQSLMDQVWSYKNNHSCVDCGEDDPRVLEFDHLPEYIKEFNISAGVQKGFSWDKILKEIEKCEIVCANHHRIRTHDRGKWVRNITISV